MAYRWEATAPRIAINFDGSLYERGWGKRPIEITKLIDEAPVMKGDGQRSIVIPLRPGN